MKVTIDVPDDILALAERLRTQDNAWTANPAFEVQEWRGIKGWRTVQTFLSAADAEAYLAQNRHNLYPTERDSTKKPNQPRVYVVGGHRNYEREALRAFLMALPTEDTAPDLVAALQDLLAATTDDERITASAKARAALAKAGGAK